MITSLHCTSNIIELTYWYFHVLTFCLCYITITRWRLNSSTSRLFTQLLIQAQMKENIMRGIHRWPGNSPHKWPVTRRKFPFDDVFMMMTFLHLVNFYFNSRSASGRYCIISLITRISSVKLIYGVIISAALYCIEMYGYNFSFNKHIDFNPLFN